MTSFSVIVNSMVMIVIGRVRISVLYQPLSAVSAKPNRSPRYMFQANADIMSACI